MTALTHISTISASDNPSGTTINSASINLVTGQHVFVYIRWESTDTTSSVSDTAGNTYTAMANAFSTNVGGRWFYCLNATGHATNVITATLGAARSYKRVHVTVLTGSTPTVVHSSTTGAATTTLALSGIVTSAGGAILGGSSAYNAELPATVADSDGLTYTPSPTRDYSAVLRALDAVGSAAKTVTCTSTSSNRVFSVLALSPPSVGGARPVCFICT